MYSPAYVIIFLALVIKVNTISNENAEPWTGKWFPKKPEEMKNPNKDLDELFDSDKNARNNTLPANKNQTESWNGKWFPKKVSEKVEVEKTDNISTKTWNGKWFPQKISNDFMKNNVNDDNSHGKNTEEKNNNTWEGNWFPQTPFNITTNNSREETTEKSDNKVWDGIWFPTSPSSELLDLADKPVSQEDQCDNGMDNIGIDFDPENKRHAYNYLCLNFKDKYEPNYSIYPTQRKYIIPPMYEAPSYCLNETITYEDRLPTFGAHRYLAPKYGEYKYLPIQRWMHSLEKGAIVMLYHPCANQMQVEKLRNAVRSCLFRHVISPSNLLLPERPLALLAWGTSLEMSVVHLPVVVEFIKENAKLGPRMIYDNNNYQAGFLVEAKLVTDESDSELCPNFNP